MGHRRPQGAESAHDSGIAIVRDPVAHKTSMTGRAAYLVQSTGPEPTPSMLTPEFSRRARGFPIYAALRSLGRDGVPTSSSAAAGWPRAWGSGASGPPASEGGVRILNEVANQGASYRFERAGADGWGVHAGGGGARAARGDLLDGGHAWHDSTP